MCRDCERTASMLLDIAVIAATDRIAPKERVARFRWAMMTAPLCCPLQLDGRVTREWAAEIAREMARITGDRKLNRS